MNHIHDRPGVEKNTTYTKTGRAEVTATPSSCREAGAEQTCTVLDALVSFSSFRMEMKYSLQEQNG